MALTVVSAALPELAPGVSVALLRRVWNATPAERKHQRATLLDSVVVVPRNGHLEAAPLRELTLPEVERVLGAVTPRFVVRFWESGKRGVQVSTFVEESDAAAFARGKRLHGRSAQVEALTRGSR